MKFLTIVLLSGCLLCSCGQGENRLDNPEGKDGSAYTDEGTTDSTRLMGDTVLTRPDSNHAKDGTDVH